MAQRLLPDDAHIGHAHLYTANIDRSLAFYEQLMGFGVLKRDGDLTVLSADGRTPHLLLTERPNWTPKPKRSTGLYHVAIRLPSRVELARLFKRMLVARYRFGGFSDHAVSEALYLDDPDGNGLELYRDRPRAEWPPMGQMTTEPLDLENLLAEADDRPWTGIAPGTDIGHVHLHVSNLDRAQAFYRDLVGFDVMLDMRAMGALFMSAGGYHHHLGTNTWAGTAPQPPNTLGLRSWAFHIPDRAAWQAALDRLAGAGVPTEAQDGSTVLVRDEDGNAVELVAATEAMAQRA